MSFKEENQGGRQETDSPQLQRGAAPAMRASERALGVAPSIAVCSGSGQGFTATWQLLLR